MKKFAAILVMVMVLANQLQAKNNEIVLSSAGKTDYSIVIGKNPTEAENTAIENLVIYLKQVTGADFTVVKESSENPDHAIYVGWTEKAKENQFNGLRMASEEWAIKTIGNSIILTGGRARGTLYAVYHFLEDYVGVRWWNVSEEYVPKKPTLKIPSIDRKETPAFQKRDICIDGGSGEYTPFDNGLWASRNRLNAIGIRNISAANGYDGGVVNWPIPWVAHTLTTYIFKPELAKEHPEYFAWNGKVRVDNKLCLTNPDIVDITAKYFDNLIQNKDYEAMKNSLPRALLYNLSEADSASLACWEPNCIKLREEEGGEAGLLLHYINAVATKLSVDHPLHIFETLAYWNTDTPPKNIKPADNVAVRLCDVQTLLTHPMTDPINQEFADKVMAWGKITNNLHFWDYNMSYSVEEPPLAMELCLGSDYQYLRECGVKQIMAEMEDFRSIIVDNWHMRGWIMAKLMENPKLDPAKLLQDYTDGYYGAAGKYIREYRYLTYKAAQQKPPYTTQLSNENAQGYRYVTVDFMRKAGALLNKATHLAKDDRVLKRRVSIARLSYDRTILRYYSFLLREWLNNGKPLKDFPFDRQAAANRVRDTEAEFADFYLIPSKREEARNTSKEIIDIALNLKDAWELPDFAKNTKPNNIFELTTQGMGWFFPHIKPVQDNAAPCGTALKYSPEKVDRESDRIFAAGIWHSWEYNGIYVKDLPGISRDDVTNSGYNWYNLVSDWEMQRGDKLYLLGWGVQAMIDYVMPSLKSGGKWDIWVNVKFEGPDYPKGEDNQQNAIYLERIILVRKP